MNTAIKNKQNDEEHPFAGCDRLLNQYRIIGQELLKLQQKAHRYTSQPKAEDLTDFGRSLIFIPTQVLQSFRDDLLNPEILTERLFIGEDRSKWYIPAFSLCGIIGAVALGVYAAASGADFFRSFILTSILSTPFVAIWNLVPKDTSLRRLRYAQWIQKVIQERNGSGDTRPRSLLKPFVFAEEDDGVQGAVSRIIIQ